MNPHPTINYPCKSCGGFSHDRGVCPRCGDRKDRVGRPRNV